MRFHKGGKRRINRKNFLSWAQKFVQTACDLTSKGRKTLKTFDEYAAHISRKVLQLFEVNNLFLYEIPSHRSRRLQSLDLVALSTSKNKVNKKIQKTLRFADIVHLEV